jgi:hypothetical protein
VFLQSSDEVELLITMPVGDKPTEIGVPVKVLHQEDGPVFSMNKFASQDRLQTCLHGFLDKKDRPIEPVCVCQGQMLHPAGLRSQAQLLESGNSPPLGIMRMDVEMNVFHGIFSKEILFPLPNLGGGGKGEGVIRLPVERYYKIY